MRDGVIRSTLLHHYGIKRKEDGKSIIDREPSQEKAEEILLEALKWRSMRRC
jgi:hypothetical protein